MTPVSERAAKIKLIIFDVDGVLTNGKIVIGNQGELYKSFDAQDGLGIALLRGSGVKTAIITGRDSSIVAVRAAELKIDAVYQGQMKKLNALGELQRKYDLALAQIAYVGDDLIDLSVMCRVGLACAVQNAVREVKAKAHFTAEHPGGAGAVREIAEMILKAQGKWEQIIFSYRQEKTGEDIAQ